jgi:hypothetical protein
MNIADDNYRKVLMALEQGAKTGQELQNELGFPSIDHCYSRVAKLSERGYIERAFRLTDKGRQEIHPSADADSIRATKPVPPKPLPGGLPLGFEWVFDEPQWIWVKRRKAEAKLSRDPDSGDLVRLFG